MKPFTLEEYLKNPSRKVVTKDGHSVRIICTDADGKAPVVALIKYEYEEIADKFRQDGTSLSGWGYRRDLFFGPEKREGWVNVYRNVRGATVFGLPYSTKEEALDELYDDEDTLIDTIKVEWEE